MLIPGRPAQPRSAGRPLRSHVATPRWATWTTPSNPSRWSTEAASPLRLLTLPYSSDPNLPEPDLVSRA